MSYSYLTITGSDGSGGSGIQADIKTGAALGITTQSVITTLTMQNTLGIQEYYDIPAEIVEQQICAMADDIVPTVVKIGMIRNVYILHAIVRCLHRYKPQWVLFSPVVNSSREERLMDDELIAQTQQELIPLCSLVVIRKQDANYFNAKYTIEADNNHGRCNELCSTIAVFLAQGATIDEAVKRAQITQLPAITTEDTSLRIIELYKQFIELLDAQCLNSHDVNYYASELNVSSRYLSQITRKVVGRSPKAIIDTSLLQHIKQLLTNPNLTIQEIAYRLKFSTQAHLSNFFKNQTGMSPSDYRTLIFTK